MPITRKQLEIPPEVGRQFAADMPAGAKLRLTEVKELFELMR
ncbi:hypothetical protein [Bradyrhizobium pachyrhizi]|nr:hypothetical protein [Bradyrhizobium pachyrhizi]